MLESKECFALALRIIGVIVFAYGFRYVIDFFLGVLGYFTLQHTDYAFYVIIGIGYLIAGLYLMRGAAAVVNFAYPVKRNAAEIAPEDEDNISSDN